MLTPLVSIISAAIGIYLKTQQHSPEWWIVASLAGALVICAFITSYYTHIKPLRDPAANGRLLLDVVGGRIVEYGKERNLPVRLNMLLVHRPPRWFFLKKYLKVRWSSPDMKFDPDGAIEFHFKKGVAGEALATGQPKLVNMEKSTDKWNFTDKELSKFPPHTMIWCYPLYELDKNGDPTGTKLGTVNMDSTHKGACDIVLKDEEFTKLMEGLRDVASKINSC